MTEQEYQHALHMIEYHEKKADEYKAITRAYHQKHEVIRIIERDEIELKPFKPLYKYATIPISNSK